MVTVLSNPPALHLALDVYPCEGSQTKALEDGLGLLHLHTCLDAAILVSSRLLDGLGSTMRPEEFTAFIVGSELKLVRQEAKRHTQISASLSAKSSPSKTFTYALEILARACRRSRSMNMFIK